MKHNINETRLFKIIDLLIVDRYGDTLKIKESNDGYKFFHIFNREMRMGPFDLSQFGRLWINDVIFFVKLKRLFAMTDDEAYGIIKKFFETKFDIKINLVTISYFKQFLLPNEDDMFDWYD